MAWIKSDYLRVSISGELVLESDMHLGSGTEDQIDLRDPRENGQSYVPYGEVCRDRLGQPYIPASSLRGFLRHRLLSLLGESDPDFKALLGNSNEKVKDQNGDVKQIGNAGLLRCYDATSTRPKDQSRLESRTSINAITGTAEEHHLFTQAMVPAGTRFKVSLELDYVSQSQLAALLAVLNNIQGQVNDSLGRGKTIAQGRVKWVAGKTYYLDQRAASEWLTQSANTRWQMQELSANRLSDYADLSARIDADAANHSRFQITLHPLSPILINDTQAVDNAPEAEDAKLIATRKNQHLCIPGASLKGMVRAQCRRILMTLLYGKLLQSLDTESANEMAQSIADQHLIEIFGGEGQRGKFHIMDALSREGEQVQDHEQTFNAIDRFTGGVADGKLYSVKAAFVGNMDSELVIHWPEHTKESEGDSSESWQWAKGLLYLCLRDAMEQQLAVGWGKARGYGRFELSIKEADSDQLHRTWNSYYSQQNDPVKQAVAALQTRLQTKMSQALAERESAAA